MRLSRLKLAGFKSFVDPTTITLPSNLVGIVGPNGCGKSNVIDAVRWVMGESSAKQLRGESKDDVIFSGSSARKPVGQASVELVFDNSDGGLGGQYAAYAELSVKRTVMRDGQSVYSLNGTRCRRRDVQDIFLGTGMGPRSYAIIQQGTVSRLIEAKPEELRVFLEEAAGISKYKERRRETENRIRHTRDNLDRLNDLREEVEKQLGHLQRQARAAERFKTLKADERELEAQLLALRWRDYRAELDAKRVTEREIETELEAALADQREAEAAIERDRATLADGQDAFNAQQAEFYRLGAEVSRAEQAIKHSRQLRESRDRDLAQAEQALGEVAQHLERDRERVALLEAELTREAPELEALDAARQRADAELGSAEQLASASRERLTDYTAERGERLRELDVQRTQAAQLERSAAHLVSQLERLDAERSGLDPDAVQADCTRAVEADRSAAVERDARARELDTAARAVGDARRRERESSEALDTLRTRVQTAQGRLAALEALQQAALRDHGSAVAAWLDSAGLASRPRLAEGLQVEHGWECAVETVLRDVLDAVQVDDVAAVGTQAASLEGGALTVLSPGEPSAHAGGGPNALAARVSGADAVADWLRGVRVADTLASALDRRPELGPGESFVTRRGERVGRNWVRIAQTEDAEVSVLAREAEMGSLAAALDTDRQALAQLESERDTLERALHDAEAAREQSQRIANEALKRATEASARRENLSQQLERAQLRTRQLTEERARLEHRRESEAAERTACLATAAAAETALSVLGQTGQSLTETQARADKALAQAREDARAAGEQGRQAAVRLESLRSQREATRENLARMEDQQRHLSQRREQLALALDDAGDPADDVDEHLAGLLERRSAAEQVLVASREKAETVELRVREGEQRRARAERVGLEVREKLNAERLASNELQVRVQTLHEQAAPLDVDLQKVLDGLPEHAAPLAWQEQLDQVQSRIQRLGAINLAAIDEYEETRKRDEQLQKQLADVNEALATLEAAIARIDKETRQRFRDTYERVNERLQHYFPRLFGGGEARLELTDSDMLSAGVHVMARPPGKRVSSIHLLSGGEKALSAVALVFGFFDLNPAPFCMLDEVDAPLDDANVGRFCELVREMSQRVQFIYISHNKQAMELADQLMGVTMNEPGVSRLVSVDVGEAATLATA
ncbi:MAG: chromosome segregation protein SMC [Pseudomonadota bacterium]